MRKKSHLESLPTDRRQVAGLDGAPVDADLVKVGSTVATQARVGLTYEIIEDDKKPEPVVIDERAPDGTGLVITLSGEPVEEIPFAHYGYTHILTCLDPSVRPRWRRLLALGKFSARKSDLWEMRFEGEPAGVRRQHVLITLLLERFDRMPGDKRRRELLQWAAVHYAARVSPLLTLSRRGDAPEKPPVRNLDGLDADAAAKTLARDLKVDRTLVREAVGIALALMAQVETLGDDVTPEAVEARLGFRQVEQIPPQQ